MLRLLKHVQLLAEARGQDLIEYALLAGFVAVTAAVIFPDIANGIEIVMFKVSFYLSRAAGTDARKVVPVLN